MTPKQIIFLTALALAMGFVVGRMCVLWTELGSGFSFADSLALVRTPAASPSWPVPLTTWRPEPAKKVCGKFGWNVWTSQSNGSIPREKPRIFYGLQGSGQPDILDLHLDEIYPLVHRISVIEVDRFNDGTERQELLDFEHPRFQRFSAKLRAKRIPYADVERAALKHQLGTGDAWTYATARVQREFLTHGFKDAQGRLEMRPGDVVVVADGDEIPTREVLQALTDCDPTDFEVARRQMAEGIGDECAKKEGRVKVLMKTQVFQSYFDCPVQAPLWWHPDAIMAECILNEQWTMENVRSRSGGGMTRVTSGRHVHNFFDDKGLVAKYSHYMHKETAQTHAACRQDRLPEMRWRACDPLAPELSNRNWHTRYWPLNEFLDKQQRRIQLSELPHGLGFALVDQQNPEFLRNFSWTAYGRHHNGPWVNESFGKGQNHFKPWGVEVVNRALQPGKNRTTNPPHA